MRNRSLLRFGVLAAFLLVIAAPGSASLTAPENSTPQAPAVHHDPVAPVLLGLVVILLGAKLGGEAFERIGQPAVLGELVVGVLIGNLDYLTGSGLFAGLQGDPFIDIFARVGVIILLFEVGLETRLGDMLKVGSSSLVVAILGVAAPMLLGFLVGEWLLPESSRNAHLFLGATLAATSVGITARVLKDMNRLQARESRIILGAAVIDDVLGLIILAVVSGIVTAGSITLFEVGRITAVSIFFLVGAILIGPQFVKLFVRYIARMRVRGMKIISALSFCFGLAYMADLIGLAPIVGAFAAGLILEEGAFEGMGGQKPLVELLEPFTTFFVPIFFVLMGIQVNLSTFADPNVMGLAAAITIAAILGKQICSLGVMEKGLDRLSVGVGMIPRGEVGLIFASIGRGLGVVDDALFTATVLMVIVTTFITPPVLKFTMSRGAARRA
ncbi:MAG TPA: cation:proton antiporter [Candidatus Polarisedimenticolia bacterium]|nr:cation:proton antiporter [Candidatus Polarisedimenticolia bacterium]